MKPAEIKATIDKNLAAIEKILQSEFFTLNLEITNLKAEIVSLQKICIHEFDENGICRICYADQKYIN